MTRFSFALMLYTTIIYSQTKEDYVSYGRTYFNNDKTVNYYEDRFRLGYGFKNNYSISGQAKVIEAAFHTDYTYNTDIVSRLYALDFGLKKQIPLGDGWSVELFLDPQLRSNFKQSLNADDFFISGYAGARKTFIKNKSTLSFSLQYGTLFGKPAPYLVFSYDHKVNNHFSYAAGFPETFFKYSLNEKHAFKVMGAFDGYYTRLNGYAKNDEYGKLSYQSLYLSKTEVALHYNYTFSGQSLVDFSVGKSLGNTLTIKEGNNDGTEFSFNNRLSVSMGFKYNLN